MRLLDFGIAKAITVTHSLTNHNLGSPSYCSPERLAKAQVDALDKALEALRLDLGRLPTTEEGLALLNTAPPNDPNWAGPYLKKEVPKDPWGRPYVYVQPGTHNNDFDLFSYGKDGQPGGTGEDADIGNW